MHRKSCLGVACVEAFHPYLQVPYAVGAATPSLPTHHHRAVSWSRLMVAFVAEAGTSCSAHHRTEGIGGGPWWAQLQADLDTPGAVAGGEAAGDAAVVAAVDVRRMGREKFGDLVRLRVEFLLGAIRRRAPRAVVR